MTDFPPPKYIDDITCREIWTETSQVILGPVGAIKLEFCVFRWTAEIPVHCDRITPVARLAMNVAAAEVLRNKLTEALEALKQQSVLAQTAPPSPMKN